MDQASRILSKSDFLEARECPKTFWLKRNRPDQFAKARPGAYDLMLMEEGKAVQRAVRGWLEDQLDEAPIAFEVEFACPEGLHARADAIRSVMGKAIDLIEIKATTNPKPHLRDITFQRIVAERCGAEVRRCVIVHLNPAYRAGIGPEGGTMFLACDVSEESAALKSAVEAEIRDMADLLGAEKIDEKGCGCRHKGSIAKRCIAFAHLNPDITEQSAHVLPNISAPRLIKLDGEGRLALSDVSVGDVTANQLPHLTAIQSDVPVIDNLQIKGFLESLAWPLHFYDYETHARAMPVACGHGPYAQVPVQFSLHVLHSTGELEHHEYLATKEGEEDALVAALAASSAATGSFVAWNMSFEKSRNRDLAEMLPWHAEFLCDVNDRTADLMVPFKTGYVHPDFRGSASIKKVLPALCPHLTYDEAAVHDGAGAMVAWREMISTKNTRRKSALQKQLLDYCKLDTLAMVEIFQFLRQVVAR